MVRKIFKKSEIELPAKKIVKFSLGRLLKLCYKLAKILRFQNSLFASNVMQKPKTNNLWFRKIQNKTTQKIKLLEIFAAYFNGLIRDCIFYFYSSTNPFYYMQFSPSISTVSNNISLQ